MSENLVKIKRNFLKFSQKIYQLAQSLINSRKGLTNLRTRVIISFVYLVSFVNFGGFHPPFSVKFKFKEKKCKKN